MARKIKCKYCNRYLKDVDAYLAHLEGSHSNIIPQNMPVDQFYYFMRTGKQFGSCIICHKKTEWNEKTHKYHRFCNNPACKDKYREEFKKRMMGKYGKVTLLDDPNQQKIMLSRRKISGEYTWHDGHTVMHYTGSYEKDFLEFLDKIIELDPEDVMAPSPHTYYYVYENKRHFYIPDVFIPSLNVEIEIKDGGSNANMHPKIQAVDKVKEQLKDEVMKSNGVFHYLKIVNKDNMRFFQFLEKMKENFSNGKEKELIFMSENTKVIPSSSTNAKYLIESVDKSDIDKDFKQRTDVKYTIKEVKPTELRKLHRDFRLLEDSADQEFKDHNSHIAVAVTDTGKLAGYLITEDKGHDPVMHMAAPVYIYKEYRGAGIGEALMRYGMQHFDVNGLEVYTDNLVAIHLYQKLGFKVVDTYNYTDEYYKKRHERPQKRHIMCLPAFYKESQANKKKAEQEERKK